MEYEVTVVIGVKVNSEKQANETVNHWLTDLEFDEQYDGYRWVATEPVKAVSQ